MTGNKLFNSRSATYLLDSIDDHFDCVVTRGRGRGAHDYSVSLNKFLALHFYIVPPIIPPFLCLLLSYIAVHAWQHFLTVERVPKFQPQHLAPKLTQYPMGSQLQLLPLQHRGQGCVPQTEKETSIS